MPNIAFDTLAYSNRLQQGGIPREQAEAMAGANFDAFRDMVSMQDLATKQDLAKLKNDLEIKLAENREAIEKSKHDLEIKIEKIRSDLEIKLAAARHDILRWVINLAVAQMSLMCVIVGIVITILKN